MVDHHRFFVLFHFVKGLPFPTFSLFGLTELDLQLERMTSVVLFPKLHENTLASNPAPCENTTSLPRSLKAPRGAAGRTTGSLNWVKRWVKPIDFCIYFPFFGLKYETSRPLSLFKWTCCLYRHPYFLYWPSILTSRRVNSKLDSRTFQL